MTLPEIKPGMFSLPSRRLGSELCLYSPNGQQMKLFPSLLRGSRESFSAAWTTMTHLPTSSFSQEHFLRKIKAVQQRRMRTKTSNTSFNIYKYPNDITTNKQLQSREAFGRGKCLQVSLGREFQQRGAAIEKVLSFVPASWITSNDGPKRWASNAG